MGSEDPESYPADGEGPVHRVEISPFRIGVTTVTNDEFAAFVADTGHRSTAEASGWSFVFAGLLPEDHPPTRGVVGSQWWRQVHGADWAHPEGPGSSVADRGDHPVVHVSWFDATTFCRWSGARLPSEAEWEHAARGGRVGATYPWGDELEPGGRHLMNVWQGDFPVRNDEADGWYGTAPVRTYPPNGHGLFETTGNVWEWCADWFDPTWYARSPTVDPTGPDTGRGRVLRGGSYLCHASYCRRYRVAARSSNDPAATTGNIGFRVAADA